MAGSSARRARRLHPIEDPEDADIDDAGAPPSDRPVPQRRLNRTAATSRRAPVAAPSPAPPAPSRPSAPREKPAGRPTDAAPAPDTARSPALLRVMGALDRRVDDPDEPTSSLRMRPQEIKVGYLAAIVLIVIPIVFLTVTTGKGAPAHPSSVLPALGLVLAVAMVATISLSNRILSAILAASSSLATTSSLVPTSVRGLSTVDLIAAMGFAVWISLRQSKARKLALVQRRKAAQAGRPGGPRPARKGRRDAKVEEPTGPPPSARYTPPKKRSP